MSMHAVPTAALLQTGAESEAPAPSFKVCGCGISYSRAAWERLPCIGWMRGRNLAIELRQCACASTIAVRVQSE